MPVFSAGSHLRDTGQSHQFSEVVPVNSCCMAYRAWRAFSSGLGAMHGWRLVAGVLLAFGASCASTGAGNAPAGPPKTFTAADLYPLEPGWKWAYDLVKDGQNMLALYSVLERSGD